MKGNKTYSLYRHTSPKGKVYIGITSQPVEHRWNNGRGYMNAKKSPFKSTIIKYGWDNIKHEVLFTGLSEERAKRLEIELIKHYKKLGISLNFTDGGEGAVGCIPWNKGIKLPYEKTNKRRGCYLTAEHKKKLSIAHKGKHYKGHKWTEEQRRKLMPQLINRHHTEETKIKISQNSAKARKVLELNALGEAIKTFASATAAGKYYGIDRSGIAKACRDKLICCGHLFTYEDDPADVSHIKYGRYKAGKDVIIENVVSGERKKFHSLSLCSRFLGYKTATSLSKAIKNNYIKNGWRVVA